MEHMEHMKRAGYIRIQVLGITRVEHMRHAHAEQLRARHAARGGVR